MKSDLVVIAYQNGAVNFGSGLCTNCPSKSKSLIHPQVLIFLSFC